MVQLLQRSDNLQTWMTSRDDVTVVKTAVEERLRAKDRSSSCSATDRAA